MVYFAFKSIIMIKKRLLSILITCFCVSYCLAQQQPTALNRVNSYSVPIGSTEKDNEIYLTALAKELTANSICGLGEASHGTHEFFTEKSRIIKHLITHEGYKLVGFEFGYSAIEPINNYLLTGAGDLKKLMKPLHLFKTKEIYDLFQAIKTYNDSQPDKTKVTLFGFDTNYIKSDIDLSALYCLDYLAKNNQLYPKTQAALPVFKKIAAPGFSYLYELSDEETAIITDLHGWLKDKENLKAKDLKRFKKHVSLLYQGTLLGNPLARDEFMAENIFDVQKETKAKTIIWGHNVHIAKDTTMAQCRGMGYYLKEKYGKQYYAVAFDTYKGTVNTLADDELEKHSFETPATSISALFAKAAPTAFFIPFNDVKSDPLYNVSGSITNIFANWSTNRSLPIRPGADFNALVFIRETTASVPLE